MVCSTHTNELQHSGDVGPFALDTGALHAHQRITTSDCHNPRTGHTVRLMRTNELQRRQCHKRHRLQRCASCAPTNYNSTAWRDTEEAKGALRAHQRITMSIEKAQQTPAQGCAPCAPTNYNTMRVIRHKNRVGALRVHQRITTEEIKKVSNQLQGAPCAHQRITTVNTVVWKKAAKVRSMHTNELQRLCRIDTTNRSWCVLCAPMNHNDILRHRYDL